MRKFVLLLALIASFITSPVLAQNFPALSGRVVDTANLLDPAQEQALTAKLAALEVQTQRQFVVTTIPDLGDYDIADYGYRLGRAWKLGGKERDDGLLLIVAPNSRKVRFEVAYGLEGVMTDAMSNQIIQSDILPRFRSKDFAGGINAGVDKAIVQLQLSPEEAAKVAAAAKTAASKQSRRSGGPDIGSIIFLLFLFFFVIIPIMRSFRGGRRYHGANVPIIIWGGDNDWGGGGGSSWGGGGGFGGGGFSGGGGSFGGGGASGGW